MLALSTVLTEIFVSTAVYGAVCIDYFQDKIFTFVLKDCGLQSLLEGHQQCSTAVKVCTSYFLFRSMLGVI